MQILFRSVVWHLCIVLAACAGPAGIQNEGNYCFFSSLLQILFHLPDVRGRTYELAQEEYVRAGKEPRSGLFYIASVFGRLQESKGGSVSISGDLYDYFIKEAPKRCYGVAEGEQGDHDEAFSWVKDELSFLEKENLLGYTVKKHTTAEGHEVETRLDYVGVANVPTGMQLDEYVGKQPPQFSAGFHPVTNDPCFIREEETITEPRSLLLFKLRGMDHETDCPNPGSRNYPSILTVAGREYQLFALSIYEGTGGSGHYYSYVQTNVLSGDWHVFNDSSATSTTLKEALKQKRRVYTVAYVASDHMNLWKTHDYQSLYAPKIPPSIEQHNQNYRPRVRYAPPPSSTGGGGGSSSGSSHGNSNSNNNNNNRKSTPDTPIPKTPSKTDDVSPSSPSSKTTKRGFRETISEVYTAIAQKMVGLTYLPLFVLSAVKSLLTGWVGLLVIICLTLGLVCGAVALILKIVKRRRARDLALKTASKVDDSSEVARPGHCYLEIEKLPPKE